MSSISTQMINATSRKTLSSRVAEINYHLEQLQSCLLVVHDLLKKEENIPNDMDEIVQLLDVNIIDLGIKYLEIKELNKNLAIDVISIAASNLSLQGNLLKATNLIAGLTAPVSNIAVLDNAARELMDSGRASVDKAGGITFTNYEALREGLRDAVERCNIENTDLLS